MSESIKEIEKKLSLLEGEALQDYLELLQTDPRSGVKKAAEKAMKREKARIAELERLYQMQEFERQYAHLGAVCGIDEAGRGPLAGPVVAAAVILPADCKLMYVNDSKQLSEKKREELFDAIKQEAVSFGIGIVGPERIDEINILQADYEAMRDAVSQLSVKPAVCLNDAVTIPGVEAEQVNLVHGDARSLSIAAASILAKVTRDRIMKEEDLKYPQYGFASHKGYGSAAHIAAIREYGPCPIHRKTFITHFVE